MELGKRIVEVKGRARVKNSAHTVEGKGVCQDAEMQEEYEGTDRGLASQKCPRSLPE